MELNFNLKELRSLAGPVDLAEVNLPEVSTNEFAWILAADLFRPFYERKILLVNILAVDVDFDHGHYIVVEADIARAAMIEK